MTRLPDSKKVRRRKKDKQKTNSRKEMWISHPPLPSSPTKRGPELCGNSEHAAHPNLKGKWEGGEDKGKRRERGGFLGWDMRGEGELRNLDREDN